MEEMWITQGGIGGPVLFVAYLLLYGLEYFFPLVNRKSSHFWTNVGMTALLVSVNVLFTSVTFGVAEWVSGNKVGLFHHVGIPTGWQIVIGVIFLDFWAGYSTHVLFHKSPFLWSLHVVHHSDEHVDVTTTFRQHPVESIVRILFTISGMVLLGMPLWMLLIYLTLSTIHAQVEHANVRLPYRLDKLLQYVFVTPNMHKIHHSKFQVETDSNYSNIFSFWDRIFKTYSSREDYASIEYGLNFPAGGSSASLWHLVLSPFRRKSKRKKNPAAF